MAQTVILTDDLNGEGNATEVNFGLDGVEYTVDLTEENAETLRNVLEPYIVAGKRVGGRARRIRRVAAQGRRHLPRDLAGPARLPARGRVKLQPHRGQPRGSPRDRPDHAVQLRHAPRRQR